MEDHEGLIIEGCAGLDDWVRSITEALTQAGILLNSTQFQNISTFKHDGLTCLLFDFEGAELDIGKFAMWRLQNSNEAAARFADRIVYDGKTGAKLMASQRKHMPPDGAERIAAYITGNRA